MGAAAKEAAAKEAAAKAAGDGTLSLGAKNIAVVKSDADAKIAADESTAKAEVKAVKDKGEDQLKNAQNAAKKKANQEAADCAAKKKADEDATAATLKKDG